MNGVCCDPRQAALVRWARPQIDADALPAAGRLVRLAARLVSGPVVGEHRELAWPFLPWMEPVPDREGWFRMPPPLRNSIPLMFTIQAHKRH